MNKTFLLAIVTFTFTSISGFTQSLNQDSNQSQKKIALVIGNGNYHMSTLANPENDARSMQVAFENVGFKVMKYENLNQAEMKKAIDDFGENLNNFDVGLFFYAGHGIQSNGYNYLIPVDASLKSEQQVEYDCVRADRVMALMEASGTNVNIIILDACRNNPFERSWTRSATGRGLAFMNAPSGTLIAYATSPGSTASDGSGHNGLYTSAILESIKIPDITILQMFQNVRSIVSQKSGKQQIPWESTSMTGDFYFGWTNSDVSLTSESQENNDSYESAELRIEVGNVIEEIDEQSKSQENNDSYESSEQRIEVGNAIEEIDEQSKSQENNDSYEPSEQRIEVGNAIEEIDEQSKNQETISINEVSSKPIISEQIISGVAVSYDLIGRDAIKLSKPDNLNAEEGVIEVGVIVNRNGKVIEVILEGQSFKTDSKSIQNMMISMAMNNYANTLKGKVFLGTALAEFNPNPDAPEFQKGTITYVFTKK